ncbi:MAG: hypothetical protein HOJ88_05890 [Proteobacteria bacterium]|nr:hypothetical protein [Pseudomonadota bacterium]
MRQDVGQVANTRTIQVYDGKSSLRLSQKFSTGLHQDEFNFVTLAQKFIGEIKVDTLGTATAEIRKEN